MAFRFESLKIWHLAREYAQKVYKVTATFPRQEDYGLTSQLNRAANSISFNIAEGSAKKSDKHFDSYLDTAVGSTFEVVSGCFRALDEKYIDQNTLDALYAESEVLAKNPSMPFVKHCGLINYPLFAICHLLSAIYYA